MKVIISLFLLSSLISQHEAHAANGGRPVERDPVPVETRNDAKVGTRTNEDGSIEQTEHLLIKRGRPSYYKGVKIMYMGSREFQVTEGGEVQTVYILMVENNRHYLKADDTLKLDDGTEFDLPGTKNDSKIVLGVVNK